MDNNTIIIYPAIFKLEENQIYSVSFPDLDGCFSQGKTLEEAFINSQEALAIYFYEKKGDVQKASKILDINHSSSESILQLVAVDLSRYSLKRTTTKFIRKNLTIPDWLHDISQKYNVNYSNILKEALIEHLKSNEKVSTYDKMILDN